MKKLLITLATSTMLMSGSAFAQTVPTDVTVISGADSANLAITQTNNNALVNWNNFNISQNETTNFNQSNTNATSMNRVIDNFTVSSNGNLIIDGNNITSDRDITITSNGPINLSNYNIQSNGGNVTITSGTISGSGVTPTQTGQGCGACVSVSASNTGATITSTGEARVVEIEGYTDAQIVALYEAGRLTFDASGNPIITPAPADVAATAPDTNLIAIAQTNQVTQAVATPSIPSTADLNLLAPSAGSNAATSPSLTAANNANAFLNQIGLLAGN